MRTTHAYNQMLIEQFSKHRTTETRGLLLYDKKLTNLKYQLFSSFFYNEKSAVLTSEVWGKGAGLIAYCRRDVFNYIKLGLHSSCNSLLPSLPTQYWGSGGIYSTSGSAQINSDKYQKFGSGSDPWLRQAKTVTEFFLFHAVIYCRL
jgi:hypothetical protein